MSKDIKKIAKENADYLEVKTKTKIDNMLTNSKCVKGKSNKYL